MPSSAESGSAPTRNASGCLSTAANRGRAAGATWPPAATAPRHSATTRRRRARSNRPVRRDEDLAPAVVALCVAECGLDILDRINVLDGRRDRAVEDAG